MKNIKRIPRIQGLTQILSLIHNPNPGTQSPIPPPSKTRKDTIQNQPNTKTTNRQLLTIVDVHKHVIKHYLANNFTIDGTFTSISGLAMYLGINEKTALGYINRYMTANDRQLKPMMDGGLARVAIFGSFFGVQEAAHKASEQLSILASSQAGEYRPFISGEVNRAVKNLLDSQKLVMEMANMLQPKQPTIAITNQNNMAVQNHAYLSPDGAQKMIEAKVQDMGLMPGSDAQLALIGPTMGFGNSDDGHEGLPGLTSLPNIIANSAQEDELKAHIMKRRAMEENGEMDTKQEKEFRDFRVDTGDGDVEVV